jgi:peptide-methionine (S)-S-oxide reductase
VLLERYSYSTFLQKMIITILALIIMFQKPENIETVVLGGGCFWCTEAIYKNTEGVVDVTPGYSGGILVNPSYSDVCSGETGHAEVVMIKFDREKIDLNKILDIFFKTHDPTTLNRQGADIGTQYRSVVFYTTEYQKKIVLEKINQLNLEKKFKHEIVTEVLPLSGFYKAEEYHLNYFNRNGNQPYCRFIIEPKIEKFKKYFPEYQKK